MLLLRPSLERPEESLGLLLWGCCQSAKCLLCAFAIDRLTAIGLKKSVKPSRSPHFRADYIDVFIMAARNTSKKY